MLFSFVSFRCRCFMHFQWSNTEDLYSQHSVETSVTISVSGLQSVLSCLVVVLINGQESVCRFYFNR